MTERFTLRASVDPVRGAGGALYLVRAGGDDLIVRSATELDHRLVRRLADAECAPDELSGDLGAPRALVDAKLASLRAADVLVPAPRSPALDPEDAERYARQLPWLAEFGDERELQRRLIGATVTVIGCGGLGTWALAALAGAGVRRLRVVDDDVVETSNLNRQVLFAARDLGRPKAVVAADWLRAFEPRAEVEPWVRRVDGPAAAGEAVAGADVVVLVADTPAYELARWVNAACIRQGTPFITAGQLPPLLKVGPFHVPGRTACFACHEDALRRESTDYEAYVAHAAAGPSRGATLGPASGIVGTLLAMEVLQLLIGAEPATAGAAILLDIRTLASRREPIARVPGCPVCGSG